MHIAITGASSGIGEALAREFGGADHKLTLVARRLELLEALAADVQAPCGVHKADLTDLATCCDWIEAAEQQHGPIDVLINNAGMQYVEPTLGISNERAERLYTLNVLAPMRLIRAVAPGMVERGGGHIVNVTSIAGITFAPGMADYSASKAALAAASETMHTELKDKGVHVFTVYPGPVSTPLEQAARDKYEAGATVDALPTGKPDELARKIRKGIASRQQRIVYPAVYGVTRHMRDISQWFTDTFSPPLAEK